MKSKKASKKDIEMVVSNLIKHLQMIERKVDAIDSIFGTFIKYKKDEKGFKKYVQKQVELAADVRDK